MVVSCKDCKYWKKWGHTHHKCLRKPKGYCPYMDAEDHNLCMTERGPLGECGPQGKKFERANWLTCLFR